MTVIGLVYSRRWITLSGTEKTELQECSTPGCHNPEAERKKTRQCLECLGRYHLSYYHRNKRRRTVVRWGTTLEEYEQTLADQGGKCANPECRLPIDDAPYGRLVFDQAQRGLLCDFCNKAKGYLQSNPDVIRGLADYLEGRRKSGPPVLSDFLRERDDSESVS